MALAAARASVFQESIMIVSKQTSGKLSTNDEKNWPPIPGLDLTDKLREAVGKTVLLILNVPNPYATGNNFPGGNFGIKVDGQLQAPTATFTYNEQVPPATGRIPTTLCVVLPRIEKAPTVVAVWQSVRGSTVNLDSPATLTAVVE
jgi:mannose-binding lectin